MLLLHSLVILIYAKAQEINLKCSGDNPRYYPGSTCQTFWICANGYQYPEERLKINRVNIKLFTKYTPSVSTEYKIVDNRFYILLKRTGL